LASFELGVISTFGFSSPVENFARCGGAKRTIED